MYRSCIFCSAALGSNESIERFPVGRSLAFDAAKGRLWAVCPKCARWNLAPIEERWEAIEEAERLFRNARLRAQRENMGLAKLPDGSRLVRVGRAQAVELAVARYGKAYRRRNLVYQAGTAGFCAAAGAGALGAGFLGLGLLPLIAGPVVVLGAAVTAVIGADQKIPIRVAEKLIRLHESTRRLAARAAPVAEWIQPSAGGERIPITRAQLAGARLEPGDAGPLRVHLPVLDLRLDGWQAERLAARRLIRLNRAGGDERDLAASVRMIASLGGPAGYVDRAARQEWEIGPGAAHYGVQALALEMALHEETERRSLDGELAMLEAMWRDAEEIAAIADRLPELPAPEPPKLQGIGNRE